MIVPNRVPRDVDSAMQWKNISGETIPAYGCFRVDAFNATTGQFDVEKPDGEEGLYYVNGPVPVADAKYGGSHMWNLPRRVAVDSNSLTVGQQVGPISGQWTMGAAGTGFRILRPPADLVAVVEKLGGGGSPPLHGKTIRCLEATGWYVVELVDELHVEPTDSTPNPTIPGGEDGTCDLCTVDGTDHETTCGTNGTTTLNRGTPTGNGTYVFAYDKRIVPLLIGGPVTVQWLGDMKGSEKLYTVINGTRPIEKYTHEEWDCCEDVDGNKTMKRIQCTTFFFEGWSCQTTEDPCP